MDRGRGHLRPAPLDRVLTEKDGAHRLTSYHWGDVGRLLYYVNLRNQTFAFADAHRAFAHAAHHNVPGPTLDTPEGHQAAKHGEHFPFGKP